MPHTKKILIYTILAVLLVNSGNLLAGGINDNDRIYGVTITSILRLPETVESLSKLPVKPTTRIVFDEWVNPEYYNDAVFQINKVSYIMGELLDSYAFNDYDLKEYKARVKAYLNYYPEKIDIWEIGNEVNGDWLGGTKGVMEKINASFDMVEANKQKTAITFYYNLGCTEDPDNEMFKWISKNIPNKMRKGLDYVFVSYYDEQCSSGEPDWNMVFDRLHAIFPNAKLGIGECGTHDKGDAETIIKKYYEMSVSNQYFVGGYFWWFFKRDCVPYTKPIWTVLSDAMKASVIKQGGK
jgi:hypothetical protein